jgi:hypothetical protein
MSKLIVNTLPDRNSVAAFVASAEGVPLEGLGLANFKVRSTIPGGDGSLLTVAKVAPSNLRGLYVLDLEQLGPQRKGLYIFDLLVENGEDRGQALSSAVIT